MSMKLIALYTRMVSAGQGAARREEGQGTLEYVGAIVIAAIVVAAVAAAFGGLDVAGAVTRATNAIFNAGG